MPPAAGLTARQVAQLVGGELIGPADIELAGVAPLERAGPGDLTFLASRRYLPYFQRSSAGAVVLAPTFRDEPAGPATRIVVREPLAAVARVLERLFPTPPPAWGVAPGAAIGRGARWRGRIALAAGAVLGRDARLGADCVIGPGAIVEDGATLGDRCRLEAHAVVHAGAELGNGVVLRAGARVGKPGFAFTPGEAGPRRVPHIGRCVLGDDVEVGANTTIDRGSVGDTRVGAGTKIDNLVQIGHNVRVGARCLIMAQVGIAGSTVVDDDVMLAGQVGLADHLHVGRGARLAAQSGVIGDVPAGATVSGYPARDHRAVLRQTAALGRLAPLVNTLERLAARHGGG